MKFLLLCAFLALLAVENDGAETSVVNDFMDKFVVAFHKTYKDDLEPYNLKNSTLDYSYKILFVKRTVRFDLYNGTVTGISTLKRDSNALLTKFGDKKIKVDMSLRAGPLDVNTRALAQIGILKKDIKIHYHIPTLQVEMEVASNRKAQIRVRRLKLTEIGETTIEVSKNGIVDRIAHFEISLLKPYLKVKVIEIIETNLKEILEEYINKNSPI